MLHLGSGHRVTLNALPVTKALPAHAVRRYPVPTAVSLQPENVATPWTSAYRVGQELVIPIKNGEGGYVADERTLDELEASGRVVVRYASGNPNGSYRDIAGICNEAGNVVGLMPHPEHAVEALTGPSSEGLGFFTSILQRLAAV